MLFLVDKWPAMVLMSVPVPRVVLRQTRYAGSIARVDEGRSWEIERGGQRENGCVCRYIEFSYGFLVLVYIYPGYSYILSLSLPYHPAVIQS